MGRLGAHLRHRVQRRRRHLPCLLSVGARAAARRPGRDWRLELWRRGPAARASGSHPLRGSGRSTSRACRSAGSRPWIGFPAVALARGAGTLWRGKRPPAVDRRRRAAGPADRLGAEHDLRARQPHPAVGQPGALARPSTTAAARCCRVTTRPSPPIPSCTHFLQAHRGDARFLVAAPNTRLVAPVIVRTGQPAMAFGGFFGNDPILRSTPSPRRWSAARCATCCWAAPRRPSDFTRWVRARHAGRPLRNGVRSSRAAAAGRSSSTT